MAESFDALLKTEEQPTEIIPEQTNEDIFKSSKFKIKGICRALCLPSKRYNPQRTIDDIRKYLTEKSTKERILYSEISSFVYGLQASEQGKFATNIENLLLYASSDENKVPDDHYKIIVKIYDHFQLTLQQKNLNSNSTDVIKAYLVESMSEAEKVISERVSETAKVDTKKIEKQYITILGIFASVVLSFVGGITFSSSVLQSVDSASVYRLLVVIDILALVLINTIYVLIKFISQINDKDYKLFKIKWLNISLIILGILVVVAWIIDAKALADFISQWLPWIK